MHKQSSAGGNSCGVSLAVMFILRPLAHSALVYGHTLLHIKEENEESLTLYRQSVAVFYRRHGYFFHSEHKGDKVTHLLIQYFQTQDNR